MRWVATVRLLSQVTTFATTVFVLRFLSQEQYGLASLAFVFMGMLDTFIDFGFGAALIQKEDLTERERSSVFWILVCIATAFVAISNVVAMFAAWFFNQPEVEELIQILAFTFLVSPIQIVCRSRLSRTLNLRLLSQCDLLGLIIRAGVTVSLAASGIGVWCLIAGFMAEKIIIAAVLIITQRWLPEWHMDLKSIRPLIRFGIKITGDRIVYFLMYRMDSIIVAKFLGAQALGLYSYAQQFVSAVLQIIMTTGVSVAYPLFSRYQNSDKLLPTLYRAERIVALISLPALAGISFVSQDLVLATVGEDWQKSSHYIQALAIAGLFQMGAALMPQLINAINRTGLNLLINIVSMIIYAAMLTVSIGFFGEQGFMVAIIVFQLCRYIAVFYTTRSILPISVIAILSAWLKALLPTVGMILSVILIQSMPLFSTPSARLCLHIIVGATIYCLINLLFFRQETLSIYRQMRM